MTAYLASRITTSPQTQRTLIATTSPLGTGPIVGTAAGAVASNTNGNYVNLDIRWQGALYKQTFDGVYRSIDDGETYQQVVSYAAFAFSNVCLGGLYINHADGIPRITVLYVNSGQVPSMKTSLTGLSGAWSAEITTGSPTQAVANFPAVYHASILAYSAAGPHVSVFNPFAGSAGFFSTSTTLSLAHYFVVWNDVPYLISRSVALTLTLTSLAGGSASNVLTIDGTLTSLIACGWVDPSTNDLIVIAYATGVWRAYSITTGLAVTVRTATMLTGGTLAGFTGTPRIAGVNYDQDANPGGPPVITALIAASVTSGSAVSAFRYNGVGTLLGGVGGAPTDSGGDVDYAWQDKNIGGERFFTPRPPGVDGTAEVDGVGKGALGIGVTRRKYRLIKPRSQILVTVGGAPATYNLATTPLATTPIQAGYVTIRGVINGIRHAASDRVTPGVIASPSTTIAVASNGAVLPQATINVASTIADSFPSAGTLIVTSSGGPQTVQYTGKTDTSFTGCTGGTGTLSTGGAVVGALMPTPGTVNYTNGAMTGTTGTLDAASVVEALSYAGTATVQWYRSMAPDEYPGATTKAPLTAPTSGTISSDDNINCLANGSEQQVSVGMSGFTAGDRVNLVPRATG